MPIRRTRELPSRTIGVKEALLEHVTTADASETDKLRGLLGSDSFSERVRAVRFLSKFNHESITRFMFTGKPVTNDYREAVVAIAEKEQHLGRVACGDDCTLRVLYHHGRAHNADYTISTVTPRCQAEVCSELGLQAIEETFDTVPDIEQHSEIELDKLFLSDKNR